MISPFHSCSLSSINFFHPFLCQLLVIQVIHNLNLRFNNLNWKNLLTKILHCFHSFFCKTLKKELKQLQNDILVIKTQKVWWRKDPFLTKWPSNIPDAIKNSVAKFNSILHWTSTKMLLCLPKSLQQSWILMFVFLVFEGCNYLSNDMVSTHARCSSSKIWSSIWNSKRIWSCRCMCFRRWRIWGLLNWFSGTILLPSLFSLSCKENK